MSIEYESHAEEEYSQLLEIQPNQGAETSFGNLKRYKRSSMSARWNALSYSRGKVGSCHNLMPPTGKFLEFETKWTGPEDDQKIKQR